MSKITNISSEQILKIDSIQSKVIKKTFGRKEDIVELHIYDINDNLLYSEYDFKDFLLDEPIESPPSTSQLPSGKEPRITKPDVKGAGDREYIPGPNGSTDGYYFNTGDQMVWVTSIKESPVLGTKPTDLSSINIDPNKILNDRAYIAGKYKLKLNIQRNKIFNSQNNPFSVKEISPSRREIRSISPNIKNLTFDKSISLFISEIETSSYFKDILLSFGSNINIIGINVLLNKNPNKHELLIKTLDPLPSSITNNSTFKIVESIIDPITITVDLGEPEFVDESVIPLQGPNFKIDVRINNSLPSSYKNYNELLEYNFTSSYHHLLNQLENKEIPQINYDYIRPISSSTETIDTPYHFENFIHFGSAVERLKNFEYKVGLIELYNGQIGDIENIASSIPNVALHNKETINSKKEKIIKGLDGYEQFLYYTTGSNKFTWPKSKANNNPLLHAVSSSEVKTWLGSEISTNTYYGGQLLSASLFDYQNEHGLINLVPKHIVDNTDNDFYGTFTHMIGQHFDHIWTHIKHLTEVNDTHHTRGISKDLVYFTLKSLGVETFDQFENSNLIEYILGEGNQGESTYNGNHYYNYNSGHPSSSGAFGLAVSSSEALVTASKSSSIPKGDITKEIWKRLYHNAPYLLKTKGTERGLRALMSCYGVPSTVLNVKEYGGPVKDKTNYKTFSYDKSSLALFGSSSNNGYFLKTAWTSSLSNALESDAKTITFRIKPERSIKQYHLFSLSGSGKYAAGTRATFDTHLILDPYTGGDISSSGDSIKYGRIQAISGSSISPYYGVLAETSYFPIYNGDFWNVHIGREENNNTIYGTVNFGAYQSNHLKHISYHTSGFDTSFSTVKFSWGGKGTNGGDFGEAQAYFCGVEQNKSIFYTHVNTLGYTGSLQEVRYYFHSASTSDILKPKTLKIQALDPFIYAGNTTSSAYDELIFRAPLGSNLVCESDQSIDTSSFHPNIDVTYVPDNTIFSNMSGARYKEVLEVHHLPTPDTGIVMTSEKVRMDEGTIDDDILSVDRRSEISVLDRQPPDFEDLGVFFSPQTEINENIIYNMGAFRLDDFIGSPLPTAQTASLYTDLRHLRKDYFKRVPKRFNYWDYIKLINQLDHTLFKMIEQWVPMKANLKTGLLIEPHYLERTKFPRELPVIDDGQTMVEGSYNTVNFTIDPNKNFTLKGAVGGGNAFTTNNFKMQGVKTGSNHLRLEQGTNFTINVTDYILDEEQHGAQAPIKPYTGTKPDNYIAYESSTLLGNVMKGRASKKYYKFGQYINKLNA